MWEFRERALFLHATVAYRFDYDSRGEPTLEGKLTGKFLD